MVILIFFQTIINIFKNAFGQGGALHCRVYSNENKLKKYALQGLNFVEYKWMFCQIEYGLPKIKGNYKVVKLEIHPVPPGFIYRVQASNQ